MRVTMSIVAWHVALAVSRLSVEEHSRPVSRKGKIASRFDFFCRSFPPYSLVQSRTDDFWTVLPISDAKHCIRQRKALQVPTQSFACAIAKLCMCYRKALHVLSQSFACAIAKLWRYRIFLVNRIRCLHLGLPFPFFSLIHLWRRMGIFVFCSFLPIIVLRD